MAKRPGIGTRSAQKTRRQRRIKMKNVITGTLPSHLAGERFIGRVRWFSERKGYGFIGWQGDKDVFLHRSAVLSQGHKILQEGQRVEFGIRHTPQGLEAMNVIELARGVERAIDHPQHNPQISREQEHSGKKRPRGSDSASTQTGLFVYSYTIQSR
jgi:CspA family cold shock protein